jgi:hypothetical protein
MAHFTPEAWLDLVRKTSPAANAAPMQEHLAEGCQECSSTRDSWEQIAGMVRRDPSFEPPADVVRVVKSWTWQPGMVSRPALLVFDSWRVGLVPGVRSTAAGSHQLLYRSGSVCIDLRIEPVPNREEVFVIGQLMDADRPSEALGAVHIAVMSGKQVMNETDTNESGEFQMAVARTQGLDLCIRQGMGEQVRLPLRLGTEQPKQRH